MDSYRRAVNGALLYVENMRAVGKLSCMQSVLSADCSLYQFGGLSVGGLSIDFHCVLTTVITTSASYNLRTRKPQITRNNCYFSTSVE